MNPVKSSTIHAFENIHVYIEYFHCHLRVDGLDGRLRTWKNFRFFLGSCSFTDYEPVCVKLICSTFQPWRRITSLRVFRRDSYLFSVFSRVRRRYWSVVSDMSLYSRTQNTPLLFPIDGRTTMTSGLIHQNLSCDTVSLDWPSWTRFDSSLSSGSSFKIVCRHFSPEMHMNFHSGEFNRSRSPLIRNQYWWFGEILFRRESVLR